MMKTLMTVALALTGCYANPVTDAQVSAVVERCKELGMAVRVFNGATSFVECVPVVTKQ
jgi:FAD/FMN-containing dehydrogenase